MRRVYEKNTKWYTKLSLRLNTLILQLILILTILGIIPTLLFMYYHMVEFDAVKVITGCITVLTITKINKAVQGG